MPFELFRDPVIPASPAGLTTNELRRYLQVGKNTVPLIVRRFGIEQMHGIYPEPVIWRQIFGLAPDDDDATAALREPLADCRWVSSLTGVPVSTMRDHLRSQRWKYNPGVQLGEASETQPARLRRWIPALIRSRRLGGPGPSFTAVLRHEVKAAVASAAPAPKSSEAPGLIQPADDIFLNLIDSSEPVSR